MHEMHTQRGRDFRNDDLIANAFDSSNSAKDSGILALFYVTVVGDEREEKFT